MKVQKIQPQTNFESRKVGRLSAEGYENLKEVLTRMNKSSTYPNPLCFKDAKIVCTIYPHGKGNGFFIDERLLTTNTPENQMIGTVVCDSFVQRRSKGQIIPLKIDNETGMVTKRRMSISERLSNLFKLFTGNYKPMSNKSIMANLEDELIDSIQNFDNIDKHIISG